MAWCLYCFGMRTLCGEIEKSARMRVEVCARQYRSIQSCMYAVLNCVFASQRIQNKSRDKRDDVQLQVCPCMQSVIHVCIADVKWKIGKRPTIIYTYMPYVQHTSTNNKANKERKKKG